MHRAKTSGNLSTNMLLGSRVGRHQKTADAKKQDSDDEDDPELEDGVRKLDKLRNLVADEVDMVI